MSILFFSFYWGIMLYWPHITERETNFMSTQQLQWEILCGYGLVWVTHAYILGDFSLCNSPPLIEGRWIICGLFRYLTHSLGRKYITFSFQHASKYLHANFWSTFKQYFKLYQLSLIFSTSSGLSPHNWQSGPARSVWFNTGKCRFLKLNFIFLIFAQT